MLNEYAENIQNEQLSDFDYVMVISFVLMQKGYDPDNFERLMREADVYRKMIHRDEGYNPETTERMIAAYKTLPEWLDEFVEKLGTRMRKYLDKPMAENWYTSFFPSPLKDGDHEGIQ